MEKFPCYFLLHVAGSWHKLKKKIWIAQEGKITLGVTGEVLFQNRPEAGKPLQSRKVAL